ncbi:MAG: hypothetical protein Q9M91_06830 [Candidatus Dojkabacteria bacterium]|nr:hypothetical protein [Candidatus Dojkabacteria bacterium]
MSQHYGEADNSIIETSLAELAFALFFVLLIFAVVKINSANQESEKQKREKMSFYKKEIMI